MNWEKFAEIIEKGWGPGVASAHDISDGVSTYTSCAKSATGKKAHVPIKPASRQCLHACSKKLRIFPRRNEFPPVSDVEIHGYFVLTQFAFG